MKSSIQLSPNKHLENISKMFKKLHNDEQLADVTLVCKEGTIKAHKLILATSSPYFHKIFTENNRDHPILIMHGVSYQLLHDLIELIYKGNVDVMPEALNSLYELAGEFQLTGISGTLRDEGEKSDTSFSEGSGHGRDTRYKGLKRVAVDYKDTGGKTDNGTSSPPKRLDVSKEAPERTEPASKKTVEESTSDIDVVNLTDDKPPELVQVREEIVKPNKPMPKPRIEEPPKLSAWARKERKFKCDLCPSSFKRSSHLTRHQLVHTGQRPYACDQCDKAFSRHDKLKNHIRKTHEADYEAEYSNYENDYYETDYSFEIPQPRATPTQQQQLQQQPQQQPQHEQEQEQSSSPLPFIISHVRSEAEDELSPPNPPKRPRGRPRKYPPVEKPLIKRGRGRPRLHSLPLPQEMRRPGQQANGENYDITNLPYGDLEYLTMPLQETDSVMIEPYVQIDTEKEGNHERNEKYNEVKKEVVQEEVCDQQTIPEKLKVLENRIAKIGECTISVANH